MSKCQTLESINWSLILEFFSLPDVLPLLPKEELEVLEGDDELAQEFFVLLHEGEFKRAKAILRIRTFQIDVISKLQGGAKNGF